jgi:hypothetical protein
MSIIDHDTPTPAVPSVSISAKKAEALKTAEAPVEVSEFAAIVQRYTLVMPPIERTKNSVAGEEQMALWVAIRKLLQSTSGQESFNRDWNSLLTAVRDGRTTVFSEDWLFRYPSYWTLGSTEYLAFRTVMHIAITTCFPDSRRADLRTIDMQGLVNAGLSHDEQQKLTAFYA